MNVAAPPVDVNFTMYVQVECPTTDPDKHVPPVTVNCTEAVPVMVGARLNVSVAVPLFEIVSVSSFVPAVTVPNASVAGDRLTEVPVPVNANTWDLLPCGSALNSAVIVPFTVPTVVPGLNTTLNKHVPSEAIVVAPLRLHAPVEIPVVFTVKPAVGVRLFNVKLSVPVYLNVIVVALLFVFTSCAANATDAGMNDS